MARRTFTDYQASVVHALGGEPSTGVDKGEIVNDALMHLAALHPWAWRRGATARLSINGPLTITDATWTNGTRTLTKTGAFTNYTFAANDVIEITGGTGATTGKYVIQSRTSNDAIVLATSIGSAADGQTDIDGRIDFPYVNLPADFGEEYTVNYNQDFARYMIRTTIDQIEMLRSAPIMSFGFTYYYAVNSGVSNSTTAGLATPRLELYPTPQESVGNALSVTYRRNVLRLTNGTDVPQIPEWMDYAFDLLCRAFAHTVEDDDPQSAAMQTFMQMLPQLKSRDGSTQGRLGVMRGGLLSRSGGYDPLYPDSIGNPTSAASP